MDKVTRRVLVTLAALFGLLFVTASIIIFSKDRDQLLAAIYLPLGLVWLIGAYLLARKTPRI